MIVLTIGLLTSDPYLEYIVILAIIISLASDCLSCGIDLPTGSFFPVLSPARPTHNQKFKVPKRPKPHLKMRGWYPCPLRPSYCLGSAHITSKLGTPVVRRPSGLHRKCFRWLPYATTRLRATKSNICFVKPSLQKDSIFRLPS
jgi:hypothetical protein